MKTILFIDDDPVCTEPYLLLLRTVFPSYQIKRILHPADAYELLNNDLTSIVCIILDVVFVPQPDAPGGINQGVVFYDNIKGTKKSTSKIPVIILTNRKHQNMPGFADFVESKGDYLLEKPNCLPSELAGIVRKILNL